MAYSKAKLKSIGDRASPCFKPFLVQLDAIISQIYFWNKNLHVSDSSSVHHQEFFKQAVSKPVRHIPLLCLQWKIPDDGQRNCPKRVEFYSKNKFEKISASRCTNFSNLFLESKLYMFPTVPLPIIRSFSLYTQQWYMTYRFADSLWARSGRNSVLIVLASCMPYTIAVCTVKNSWWWAEELSETCRFLILKINLRNWCI